MKIQDAFDQDAIDEAQTDLDPAEEAELKQLVTQLFQANTMDYDEGLLNLIVVVFTAGRDLPGRPAATDDRGVNEPGDGE